MNRFSRWKTWRQNAVVTVTLLFLAPLALAAERSADMFVDVSAQVGLSHKGPTYGASWGDLNGDGWPDLWVGNHNSKPSVYLNNRGQNLQDVVDSVWSGDASADTHGAAWADFDNDGDQDLIETVAATIENDVMCLGCGTNQLFVNQSGRLVESAAAYGLAQTGFARSPLWLDVNRDGRLDLLVSNLRKPNSSSSVLMINKPAGFERKFLGFHERQRERRRVKLRQWFNRAMNADFRLPTRVVTKRHHSFMQLADLTGDGRLELINHTQPLRVFVLDLPRMKEITQELAFPELRQTGDAAIADFDGNGFADIYFTRGPYRSSQVETLGERELNATLLAHNPKVDPAAGKGFSFVTDGRVEISIDPPWLPLDSVLVGAGLQNAEQRTLVFESHEAVALGVPALEDLPEGAVGIGYDAAAGRWVLRNRKLGEFVDFVVRSNAPISDVQRLGFGEFAEQGGDVLLLNTDGQFTESPLQGRAGEATGCHSVTAADFDNDMDVDLYLVCSESVRNRPNRLLLNDGEGNFTVAAGAGGAAGSFAGRGDVAVAADYNRDGFVDLFVANGSDPDSPFVADGPHQLFRNTSNDNHYLLIDLVGAESNRDAVGAQVRLLAGGKMQHRDQNGGMHRFSQDHQRLHFGLGDNTVANEVTVRWPDGSEQTLRDVAADQVLRVVQGETAQAQTQEWAQESAR